MAATQQYGALAYSPIDTPRSGPDFTPAEVRALRHIVAAWLAGAPSAPDYPAAYRGAVAKLGVEPPWWLARGPAADPQDEDDE